MCVYVREEILVFEPLKKCVRIKSWFYCRVFGLGKGWVYECSCDCCGYGFKFKGMHYFSEIPHKDRSTNVCVHLFHNMFTFSH